MASRLIKLADGTLVEVEAHLDDVRQIAASDAAKKVDKSIDLINPILIRACRPIIAAWNELSVEADIEHGEVELGLSFEAEGDVYVVRGAASANVVVKLTLKPKA
ncbi:MAG: hypothetical protein MI924_13075 [Chloroflexales bacterium]|nr:hypothetical protein [Chloroflexales bacterium]